MQTSLEHVDKVEPVVLDEVRAQVEDAGVGEEYAGLRHGERQPDAVSLPHRAPARQQSPVRAIT